MAIWPSSTVRVDEVVLTISFYDPEYPTQFLAKLSHTMITQTMLYMSTGDMKSAWIDSGNSKNSGVIPGKIIISHYSLFKRFK